MDASPNLPRQGRVPVFNLPAIVTVTIVLLVAIHLARALLPEMWDIHVLVDLSFIPARWTASFDPGAVAAIVEGAATQDDPQIAAAQRDFARAIVADPSAMPWTLASYGLLHGSWLHVIFNVVWLAAFGAPVARRYGPVRFGLLFLVGVVAGAVLHLLLEPRSVMPLIGASAGVSALMAAASRFVFQRPPAFQPAMAWQIPPRLPLETIPELLRNRTAMLFIGIWLATNLLFGLAAVPLGAGEGPVAWDAHLGGFLVGFLLLPLFEPRGG